MSTVKAGAGYENARTPVLIGHRGSRTRFTENTLEAIEEGARGGAVGAEIDVRTTASGVLVVMHDETLTRVTAGSDERSVASLELPALARVRLPCGAHIPTLDEVLELCRARGLLLNVELKRDVPDRAVATRAAAATLRASPWREHVVVSSFDPLMLAGVAVLAPRLARALLLEPEHRYLELGTGLLGAQAIHPAAALVTPPRVRRWQARGLRVVPWTVNEVHAARRLLTLGVDGVITDDPGALRPLFTSAAS